MYRTNNKLHRLNVGTVNSSFQKILLQMYVRPIIQHSPDFTRYMVQSCTKNCIKMDIIIHLLVFLNFYSHVQNLSRHFLELKEAEISVSFQLASITLLYCCNNTQNTTILMKNPDSTPQVLIYLSNYYEIITGLYAMTDCLAYTSW